MIPKGLKYILGFISLVLIQVLVLNYISFFRIATPFLYLYFIFKLPYRLDRSLVLILSFLLGFLIDIFSNTSGMHAFATTVVGFISSPILSLQIKEDEGEHFVASYNTLGFLGFFRYAFILFLIHHSILLMLESMSLFDPLYLVFRIGACVGLSLILTLIVEAFNIKSHG